MSDKTGVPFNAIQNAVYTLFKTAPAITGGVYDEVPSDSVTWPYTVLGEPQDSPLEARDVKGRAVLFPFESFSRNYGGKQEIYTIQGQIITKLTAGKLTITGWNEVWKTYNQGKVERIEKEASPLVYKGIITMLIVVAKS